MANVSNLHGNSTCVVPLLTVYNEMALYSVVILYASVLLKVHYDLQY